MKRFLNIILSLLMVFAVACSLITVSGAADSTITFKGKDHGFTFAPGSEYTESDLFDNFKGVMPGDIRSETITVTNNSDDSDYIKLFIRAEEHDDVKNPLSENVAATGETVATMMEFLSQLSMKVTQGDEVIFDDAASSVGGFAENVFLGVIRKGETVELDVDLTVPTELDDKFQNRVGEVDWVFTAELFDDPVPPPETTLLTVHKVWVDDGSNRPESVKVTLLCDGEIYSETELSDKNQWTFTWDQLEEDRTWTVEETEVPDGYTVSYIIEGSVVTIINTEDKDPDTPPTVEPDVPPTVEPDTPPTVEPVHLTVKKEWSGDENNLSDRPESVKATLYNGEKAVETVILGDWNDWEYTWNNLDGNVEWKVIETDIPKGYTPTYTTDGDTVTITNVASLVQTGQLKWPVPVLAGFGIMLVAVGGFIIVRKRKKDNV